MNKKCYIIFSLIFFLSSCQENNQIVNVIEKVENYTVKFYNDDELLFVDTVHKGDSSCYPFEDPIKNDNEQYKYKFLKWVDKDGNDVDLSNIQNDISCYTYFSLIDKEYDVSFYSFDKLLCSETKKYGDILDFYYYKNYVSNYDNEFVSISFKGFTDGVDFFNNTFPSVTNNTKYMATYEYNYKEKYLLDKWDGKDISFTKGDGSENNPYIIEKAGNLSYLMNNCKNNNYYKNKFFLLTNDLDLNNIEWNGIGETNSSKGFSGTFLGNGHVIQNVNLNYRTRTGFFRSISSYGSVSNLIIEGVINGNESVDYVSLLCSINAGKIDNCTAIGNLNTNANYVSLIASYSTNEVINCKSYGYVKGKNALAGITSYVAKANQSKPFCNNINYANIETSNKINLSNLSGVGGVIGLIGSNLIVDNCFNYGNVNAFYSDGGTGGIVGNGFSSTIKNSKNYGLIKANSSAGGIIGYARVGGMVNSSNNYGYIIGNYAIGGINGYNRYFLESCKNEGVIIGLKNSYWVGGIAGIQGGGTNGTIIKNCENNAYVIGTGSSNGGVGGIAGSSYNKVQILYSINYKQISGNLMFTGGIVGENRNGASVGRCKNYSSNKLIGINKSSSELIYYNN